MVKGMYYYLRQAWKKPNPERLRELMFKWRQDTAIVTIEKPTRIDRARSLGYKAKKGFVIARVRVKRGGRQRDRTNKARKPKKHTIRKVVKLNYQTIAEIRASKAYTNLEVLNSYNLAKDGKYYFYEVILVDPSRPEIKNDKTINWICSTKHTNRALRGLTSSGQRGRGLRNRNPMNKNRPSVRAGMGRGK